MKKLYTTLTLLLLTVFAFNQAVAQFDVIEVKEAAKLINNDNVTVISARTPADFQKVHLPGAINVNHKDLYGEKSMLLPTNQLATLLGEKGVNSNNTLLIYDDGSSKYSGRLYWIFTYLGAKDVKVINGGMKAWRMGRKPVTKNPTNVTPATFTANPNAALIATMAEVKKALNSSSSVIVDARTADEFNGVATTTLRPGKIPSAVNFNFEDVLNEKGLLKTADELNAAFSAKGITKDKSVIVYCESSVRAGIVFLTLKGLGYSKVAVYDGAYLEWQSISSNTVAMN